MKNKDGIVIKTGQVWTDSPGTAKILSFDKNPVEPEYEIQIRWKEGTLDEVKRSWFDGETLLISDGANLAAAQDDGWLIWVEGMERPDLDLIEEYEAWQSGEWTPLAIGPHFAEAYAYRYKLKQEEPEPVEPVESFKEQVQEGMQDRFEDLKRHTAEKAEPENGFIQQGQPEHPQFKLFEMAFRNDPLYINQRGRKYCCYVGQLVIDNEGKEHRVIWYTDQEEWVSITAEIQKSVGCKGVSPDTHPNPCDHTGNRKFAIGRLEE